MGKALIFIAVLSMAMGCQIEMPEGQFECDNNEDCPENWFCDSDELCYKSDASTATDDTE